MADPDLEKAREALERSLSRSGAVHLDAASAAASAGRAANIYLADPSRRTCGREARDVARVYRRTKTFSAGTSPGSPARGTSTSARCRRCRLAYGRCTGCGRCSITARGSRHRLGVRARATRGRFRRPRSEGHPGHVDNQSRPEPDGDPDGGVLETSNWLVRDSRASEQPDARLRSTSRGPDPLTSQSTGGEVFPLSLQAAAGSSTRRGELDPLQQESYDVTNYGLFAGTTTRRRS